MRLYILVCKTLNRVRFIIIIIIIIITIYPLTTTVVGAPQITSQPVSSIHFLLWGKLVGIKLQRRKAYFHCEELLGCVYIHVYISP